jgi:hypothetical protein
MKVLLRVIYYRNTELLDFNLFDRHALKSPLEETLAYFL